MRRKLSGFVAALLIAAVAPASAGTYSPLYAFGDSLSDAGNVYIYTGGAAPVPLPGFQPAPPYFHGEFSNGPNWVEDLSSKLGLVGPVLPSLAPGGTDYAWGGATTGYSLTDNPSPTVPNGIQQVQAFLSALNNQSAPSTALYTITLGGNDVSNILTQLQNGTISGSTAAAEAQGAAGVEAAEVSALAGAGAKTLIVALVGDLGATPGLNKTALAGEATTLSVDYNSALQSDLSGVAGVRFLNVISLLKEVQANPKAYGFTDLTDPCYVGPYTGGGTVCGTPNSYLFWDNVHPSAAADVFIADAATALLAPAPSPGAGLLSLGALILMGLIRKAPELLARLSGI